MKKNYFKSFFTAFGIIPLLIAIVGLTAVGYLLFGGVNVGNLSSLKNILQGALIAVFIGVTFAGISGLRSEKVGMLDFTRVVVLISGIILMIYAINANNRADGARTFEVVTYSVCAGVSLVQLVIRAIFARESEASYSFKYYFGAFANKYNPLIVLLVSGVLSVLLVILCGANDGLNKITWVKDMLAIFKNKYILLGAVVGVVGVTFVLAADKDNEVNLIDLVAVTGLVTLMITTVFGISINTVKTTKFLILATAALLAFVILRAVTYSAGKSYSKTEHKVRCYYKDSLENYDPFLWLGLAFGAILVFGLLASQNALVEGKNAANLGFEGFLRTYGKQYKLLRQIANNYDTMTTIALSLMGVIFVGLLGGCFNPKKLRSNKVVYIDAFLLTLLFGSFVSVVYTTFLFTGKNAFAGNAGLIVAYIIYLIVFVLSAGLTFIRIRNYDSLAFIQEAAMKETEETAEEEVEETEEEATEEETTDEEELEDETLALLEEIEEEAAEEEVVEEEVVEEETTEEEVVEEVVEEEVVEETTEEVVEETEEEELEEESEDETEDEVDDAEEEAEETSEEDSTMNVVINDFVSASDDTNQRRIRRKFNTKMMFAPYETKQYYSEIKNYLQLYRAKGRNSARCETFRYKGLVAKVALGGKSIKVFLALDPQEVMQYPKYRFKDCSDKKQYAEVPVMIKVRSDRGLKHFKELVDLMMAKRLVKPKRKYEPTDYVQQLIPNGEAILGSLGLSSDYLQNVMNSKMIPEEMPTDLEQYLPMVQEEPLQEEEVEATVYLDTLCNHFEDGGVVTIDVLKSLHVVTKGNVIRVKARGTLDRKLTIYAEYFDVDALQMLMCTSSTAIKIVRDVEEEVTE